MQKPDHIVFAHAVAYDRIIITKNGKDFRKLAAGTPIHAGIVIIADGEREALWALVLAALEYLALQPQSADYMVNRILEVSVGGQVDASMMPPE